MKPMRKRRGFVTSPSKENRLEQRIAYVLSRLFGPVPLLCLLWLVTAIKSGIGFWKALWIYPIIFLVGIAMPSILTLVYLRRSHQDLDWSNRSHRIVGYVVFGFSFGLTLLLVKYFTNSTIYHLSLLAGLIFCLVAMTTTVLKFKISNHVAGASGVFWGINFLTSFNFWWLFLLLIPIIWSRYILKAHTLAELFAGLILTNVLVIAALVLFGTPNIPG